MFTAHDRNDVSDPRIAAYLPRFGAAAPPAPDANEWESWRSLLASTDAAAGVRAMSFQTDSGFGTSSSSLLALPSPEAVFGPEKKRPQWLFAPGPPQSTAFEAVKA